MPGYRRLAAVSLIVACLLLSACGHTSRAPISDKTVSGSKSPVVSQNTKSRARGRVPSTYVVKRGDTLQAIAWKFRLNHNNIARWNNLKNPNLIFVGQRLSLVPPENGQYAARPRAKTKSSKRQNKPSTTTNAKINWRWPANGKIFAARSSLGSKGIEIHGKRGSPVIAAASGKVVYSGDGLRGYGNLIIVQHNATFLSAYAHNEKLLVSEGAKVAAGKTIATMGNSGTKQVMLHFEIRRNGKAVEPTNYLPRR